MPSSGRASHACTCLVVRSTHRRLTALLLVPRSDSSGPSGSSDDSYLRVDTPASICVTARSPRRVLVTERAPTRQRHLAPVLVADARAVGRHPPAAHHELARRVPGTRACPPRIMLVPRTAQR